MEFEYMAYIIAIFTGIVICGIGSFASKWSSRMEAIVETICAVLACGSFIIWFGLSNIWIMLALGSQSYLSFHMLFPNRKKLKKIRMERKGERISQVHFERSFSRIFVDISILLLFSTVSILLMIFGPETSWLLKVILLWGLVTACSGVINRIWIFYTLQIYITDGEHLFIDTNNTPKKYPLRDLKELRVESGIDFLRINSMFTMFTSSTDYSTKFGKVIRLVFPGEIIYLTVDDTDHWKTYFEQFVTEHTEKDEKKVNHILHISTLKRLIGKGYFAISVKGVSAYTTLLLILFWLDVPAWGMTVAVIGYWIFNLWISDKVLQIAMDAEEMEDPELLYRARQIFNKLGVRNTKLYQTESADYNALATGLNTGRAMITLTTETMKLDSKHVDAIIAHEAVHVKERDVLWSQVYRFVYLGVLIGIVFLLQGMIEDYGKELSIYLIGFVWILLVGFGIFLSIVHQVAEVRADHLGASILEGAHIQMAEALAELSEKQDRAVEKSSKYQMANRNGQEVKNRKLNSLERDGWLWRVIEFQLMPHPPMYWRIESLKRNAEGWGKSIIWRWWKDRFFDSLPDRKKKRVVPQEDHIRKIRS